MVKKCCVVKCRSESYAGCGISFHKFPKKEDTKKLWLDIVPVTRKITDNSLVCSVHFKPEDFHTYCSRQALNHDAVPSIFPETNNEKMWVSNVALQLNAVAVLNSPELNEVNMTNVVNEINALNALNMITESDLVPPPAKAICPEVKEVSVQTDIKNFSANYESLQGKLRILRQKLRRRDKQLTSLRSTVKILKKKCNNYERGTNVVETISLNEISNKSVKYTEEFKQFSLSLYIHSPKSYLFLRKSLSLPHPTTIRKMLASYKGDASVLAEVEEDITDLESDEEIIEPSSSLSKEYIESSSPNCKDLN